MSSSTVSTPPSTATDGSTVPDSTLGPRTDGGADGSEARTGTETSAARRKGLKDRMKHWASREKKDRTETGTGTATTADASSKGRSDPPPTESEATSSQPPTSYAQPDTVQTRPSTAASTSEPLPRWSKPVVSSTAPIGFEATAGGQTHITHSVMPDGTQKTDIYLPRDAGPAAYALGKDYFIEHVPLDTAAGVNYWAVRLGKMDMSQLQASMPPATYASAPSAPPAYNAADSIAQSGGQTMSGGLGTASKAPSSTRTQESRNDHIYDAAESSGRTPPPSTGKRGVKFTDGDTATDTSNDSRSAPDTDTSTTDNRKRRKLQKNRPSSDANTDETDASRTSSQRKDRQRSRSPDSVKRVPKGYDGNSFADWLRSTDHRSAADSGVSDVDWRDKKLAVFEAARDALYQRYDLSQAHPDTVTNLASELTDIAMTGASQVGPSDPGFDQISERINDRMDTLASSIPGASGSGINPDVDLYDLVSADTRHQLSTPGRKYSLMATADDGSTVPLSEWIHSKGDPSQRWHDFALISDAMRRHSDILADPDNAAVNIVSTAATDFANGPASAERWNSIIAAAERRALAPSPGETASDSLYDTVDEDEDGYEEASESADGMSRRDRDRETGARQAEQDLEDGTGSYQDDTSRANMRANMAMEQADRERRARGARYS